MVALVALVVGALVVAAWKVDRQARAAKVVGLAPDVLRESPLAATWALKSPERWALWQRPFALVSSQEGVLRLRTSFLSPDAKTIVY